MSLSGEALGLGAAVYEPRRPADTVLHGVVRENLESFIERANGIPDGDPVPAYVERTFREYLKCGILAEGFARAWCPACGQDFLVAFSCKLRGLCPSCEARHKAETAAHLVDHVIPRVPTRHWVLSLPRRIRWHCAHRPDVASGLLRVFLRAVETRLRQRSPGAPRAARFGAVAFEHRGGSFLNANFHWHVKATDGVFAAGEGGEAEFFEATDLTDDDVEELEALIRRRILRWLARHEILDEHSAEEMLAWEHQGGFSLDASTRIEGWDRQGLERLARYCARQPFSLERLERYDGERLIYRFPRTSPEGRNYVVLTPFQLLSRLAKLIPPPYKHRVRYFGVFAPNAKLREAVVSSAGPAAALQSRLSDAARKMGIEG